MDKPLFSFLNKSHFQFVTMTEVELQTIKNGSSGVQADYLDYLDYEFAR